MPQERGSRASKVKEMDNMAGSVERPINIFVDAEEEIIKLGISKSLWNACKPQCYRISKPQPTCHCKTLRPARVSKARAKKVPIPTYSPPRQCKSRFFRFHYGGPKRQKRGERENDITHEAPCLEISCANCWKWNAHLMSTGREVEDRPMPQPSAEPISPVDEHTYNSQCRHDSVLSATSSTDEPCPITTIAFHSHAGKQKYAALIHAREKKQMKDEWSRGGGLAWREASPSSEGDSVSVGSARSESSSGRSRHRVRLVFKSADGKGDFRRLVQSYRG